jgi:drug/metabolite transporter (DMT)-like permease
MARNYLYTMLSLVSAILCGVSFPVAVDAIGMWGAGGVLATVYAVAAVVTFGIVAGRYGVRATLRAKFSALRLPELLLRMILFLGYVGPLYIALEIVDRAFLGGVFLCFFVWPVLSFAYFSWLANVKTSRRLALCVGASCMVLALAVEFREQAFVGLSDQRNIVAYVLAFIAANSCALYAAVTRRFRSTEQGDVLAPILCLSVALCGVVVSLGSPHGPFFVSSWGLGLLGCVTGLAQLFWDAGVRRGDAFVATAAAYLTPWIGILFASAFLGVSLVDRVQESGTLLLLALFSLGTVIGACRTETASPRHY